MKTLRVPSYAKVNLGLEVLSPRPDGYHELRTLFQTIDLKDELTLNAARKGIEVTCDDPRVPTGGDNLAFRAASALALASGSTRGVRIRIQKRIPVGGGLGGGSSNAASTLLALNRLWGLKLPLAELHAIARRLGADVPFFLLGGTALGVGRGDEVYPLPRQVRGHVVLVDPGKGVSTAAIFRRIDESLTPPVKSYMIFRFVSRDLERQHDAFRILSNDLEAPFLEEAPELGRNVSVLRGVLRREGAKLAAVSGSGSCFFGFFEEARQARRAERALQSAGHRTLRSRTLSLGEYRRKWSGYFGS